MRTMIILIVAGFILLGLMWIPDFERDIDKLAFVKMYEMKDDGKIETHGRVMVPTNKRITVPIKDEVYKNENSESKVSVKETATWLIGIMNAVLTMIVLFKKIILKKSS